MYFVGEGAMRNLAFLIWMLGFPLVEAVSGYMAHLSWGLRFTSNEQMLLYSVFSGSLWLFVGWKLFEPAE